MGDSQSPKDECEKFLARQKPWVRAFLQGERGQADILPPLAAPGGIEALYKAMDEYEELLKHCPMHLREYRQRTEANAKQSARASMLHLGPVKAGRPPSREAQERGRRAARLFDKGLTLGQNWANPPMPHYDQGNDAMTIGFLMAGSPTAERTTSSYSEDIKSAFPVAKSTGKDSCSCTINHFPLIFLKTSVTRTAMFTREPFLSVK